MEPGKDYRYQEDAKPTRAPDKLRPPVYEALQDVLLDQAPTKTQKQLGQNGSIGMPSQEI